MPLKPEVIDRLLLSKAFLERIRYQPVEAKDRHTLAANIIASHDAAELAIAAICDELGCLPKNMSKSYLMDYFDPLEKAQKKSAHGREYFRQLNGVRNLLKHQGLYPDAKQWSRVGEIVFQHVNKWCWDFLTTSFADLDESALLAEVNVKHLYDESKEIAASGNFKGALEKIALALSLVFSGNAALRGLEAGHPSSDDAIRLAGFGVHANDFLALQQFLPYVSSWGDKKGVPQWKQSMFGHPGNWTERNVDFCLKTFVDVAVKIQGAQYVPKAWERIMLYDQQIEALKDGVIIWNEVKRDSKGRLLTGFEAFAPGEVQKETVRTLKLGETLQVVASIATESSGSSMQDALMGGGVKNPKVLTVMKLEKDAFLMGKVFAEEVKVTCVPKEADYIKQYFGWLPTFEWEPD